MIFVRSQERFFFMPCCTCNIFLLLVLDAFKESLDGLSKYSDGLSEYFVKYLSEEGMQQLENAKNVPRLYRRTNREVG